ncbi:hypothetical protein BX070DRAFT_27643 [Coemansia spiralis]|nr:hypothetical protein BX070DRAFT_27643 [Coemansia spiralis]
MLLHIGWSLFLHLVSLISLFIALLFYYIENVFSSCFISIDKCHIAWHCNTISIKLPLLAKL